MKKKNVVLLSTRTTHHFFFINQLSKISNLSVVFEENLFKPKIKTKHNYEKKQNLFEKKKWFNNKKIKISKNIKILNVKNINNTQTINFIKKKNPDIIFSFGISRIKDKFLNKLKKNIYNFHGGDTSFYRGLDSHLWSLYHNDLNGLKVTLHLIDGNLDTGNILIKKKLNLKNSKKLYQLRLLNTELCVKIAKDFLNDPKIKKYKQKNIGRYYSYMPKELKNIVNNSYEKKIKKIYNDNK